MKIASQATYFVIIARLLGVQEFGLFAAALALVSILSPFAALGSGNLMVMHVARDRTQFAKRWGEALVMIPVFGVPLALATVVVGHALVPGVSLELIAGISLSEFFVSRLCDTAAQAFQAFDRMVLNALLTLLPSAARLTAACLAAVAGVSRAAQWAWWYTGSTAVAALVAYLVVRWILGPASLKRHLRLADLRDGAYFAAAQAAVSIYTDIDKALLARLGTLSGAGIYAAAYRATSLAFVPVFSLLTATYPRFFKAGVDGVRGSHALARRLVPAVTIYGLLAAVALFVAAPLFPLVLGSDFNEAVEAIRWLSLVPLIQGTYYLAGDVLTGAGRQGLRTIIQAGAAVLDIGLCFSLIPAYGWRGAAWATLISLSALSIALWTAAFALRRRESLLAHAARLHVGAWPAFDARNGNPYNRLLYSSVRSVDETIHVADRSPALGLLRHPPDIWHVHWPERAARHSNLAGALLKALFFCLMTTGSRMRGTRIVWTVHNLKGHDAPFPKLERALLGWLSRHTDGYIALSDRGAQAAKAAYPSLNRLPGEVVSHGHFIDAYPRREPTPRITESERSIRTLVFIGAISPYKNVPLLIHCFRDLQDINLRLIVAGRPWSDALADEVREAAHGDERITLRLDRVADDEVQPLLHDADLVVLPFREILNSGSVILALSCHCPVLAPTLGAIPELQAEFGSTWVRSYAGQLSPRDIQEALTYPPPDTSDISFLVQTLRTRHDWGIAGKQTAAFYRRLAGHPYSSVA